MGQGVSLKPSDLIESQGLIDDEDVTITKAKFTMFDYGGKSVAVPAAGFTLDRGDGDTVEQYYSAGKSADWLPSEDGKTLTPVGKAKGLSNSSNWAVFITAMVNAGFPENKLSDDISVFEGMECHVVRVPAPERKGLNQEKKDQTVLIVNKIHKLPWEKGKPKGKGKGKSTGTNGKTNGKPTPPGGSNSDSDSDSLQDKATEFIMTALAESPNGIKKASLSQLVFKKLKDDPDRNKLVQLVFDDGYLNSQPFWTVENGVIKAAE